MYAQIAPIGLLSVDDREDGRDEVWGIVGMVAASTLLTLMFLAVCFAGAHSATLRKSAPFPKFMSGYTMTAPPAAPRRQIEI